MNNDELKGVFDQQASIYDKQWTRMAPINNGLYFLLESVFAELPSEARVLCVGVGTGKELIHLAKRFPGWRFTAVEPSGAMLDVCRHQVEEVGFTSRCYFHEGYLDSLPVEEMHDAATCFLVSQFILEQKARSDFFQQIANRLQPDGILASSDLSSEVDSENYDAILGVWQKVMATSDVSPKGLSQMKAAYAKDVAVLPPTAVASIIKSGGFEVPVQFFQAGLIHAWFAKRDSGNVA
ncbi:class I SAM-dependent methyltransferase [Microcoleus sp. Pol11C1]|uniref:class I SAM-dependent methyltransferase n=1 Tax=unclassified Microcoleus TaxID=2642155 RepID=UPI002FD2124A